jgi:hypothetical protein
MSVALEHKPPFAIEPITYPIIEERIEELATAYLPLKINGVEDKEGMRAVHEARMNMKGLRVQVEKRRKELKASALQYGQQVDGAAKQLVELMDPIECHLESEENRINHEKERLRKEAEEQRRAAAQSRVDALLAVGVNLPYALAEQMPEEAYQERLTEATEAYRIVKEKAEAEEAERLRKQAEEDAQRKAEAERLAAERAELERLRAQQEEAARIEREKIEAERAKIREHEEAIAAEAKRIADARAAEERRVADEQAAKDRAAELEKAKKEAAAKAERETRERIARENEEAAKKAARADAKRKRAEALRPDKEKLIGVADRLAEVEVPELSEAAGSARLDAVEAIFRAAQAIREIAAELDGGE